MCPSPKDCKILWTLCGVSHNHRTDSLSPAFKNLDKTAKDDLTDRFDALC